MIQGVARLGLLALAGCAVAPAPDQVDLSQPAESAAEQRLGQGLEGEQLADVLLELATLDGGDPLVGVGRASTGHIFSHLGGPLEPSRVPEGHLALGFDDLLAPDWPPPQVLDSAPRPDLDRVLPGGVLQANGQLAAFEGFVIPADGRGERTRRWILTPAPNGCCRTGLATFDQFVWVELAPDPSGTEPDWYVDPYRPVAVAGRFRVEERRDDFGFLECLYRLDEAHRIGSPTPTRP